MGKKSSQSAKMNSIPTILFAFSLLIHSSDQGETRSLSENLLMDQFDQGGWRASRETREAKICGTDEEAMVQMYVFATLFSISLVFNLMVMVYCSMDCFFKLCGWKNPRTVNVEVVNPL